MSVSRGREREIPAPPHFVRDGLDEPNQTFLLLFTFITLLPSCVYVPNTAKAGGRSWPNLQSAICNLQSAVCLSVCLSGKSGQQQSTADSSVSGCRWSVMRGTAAHGLSVVSTSGERTILPPSSTSVWGRGTCFEKQLANASSAGSR